MAESSSISEEPPNEKPGLGFLIHGTSQSDPIATVPVSESENGGNDSPAKDEILEENEMGEEEFRINIEKERCKLSLEQDEIEATRSRLEAVNDVEETNDPITEEKDDLDEEKVGKGVEGDTENEVVVDGWGLQDTENQVVVDGWGIEADGWNAGKNGHAERVELVNENEEIVGDQSEEGSSAKVGRHNHGNNQRKSNYPMRPDADDCTYYMKFGTCKFGLNCKFNHPPRRKNQGVKEKVKHGEENSERTGQTDCKYHMTPGGCKFGNECKYNHGSDNSYISHTPELNFLGLPIRLGEKECPYYMSTGSCKYGSSCRLHHPEPTTIGGSDPGHGNGGSLQPSQIHPSSSWSSLPRAFNGTSPFPPVMFPPTQGVAPPNPEWNGYQAGTYQTSERGLPTPPAFAMKNLPTQINLPLPHHLGMVVDEYPERPGEPECSFFLKTGDCKYKSSCKFHHPKNRKAKAKAKAKANSYALSEKGLPLRPGQPICTHYHQYGICKYGPACKYDHPSNIGVSPTPFS